MEQEKHMCRILRCKTDQEAAAEVVNYFGRVNDIKEKYAAHEAEILEEGIHL